VPLLRLLPLLINGLWPKEYADVLSIPTSPNDSEVLMNAKKPTTGKQTPVHVIRSGETTAAIYLAQSNGGFRYYQFVLGRTWTSMTSRKEASGNSFFESNEKELVDLIHQASAWIREKLQSGSESESPAPLLNTEE
jgi:hypothetical protein